MANNSQSYHLPVVNKRILSKVAHDKSNKTVYRSFEKKTTEEGSTQSICLLKNKSGIKI